MKITIYELLGMIIDGKAPKKIKVTGTIYEYDEEFGFYFTKTKNGRVALGGKLNEINLIYNYNSENNVEILEEENELPEKIDVIAYDKCIHEVTHKEKQLALEIRETQIAFNEIIDYLKSKKE